MKKLKLKSIIPNSLTALNLFCGCLAVLAFLYDAFLLGVILIFVAALADFFDGFAARLLNVQSELGKQLDSLADMISFGFVPGIIMFKALIGDKSSDINQLIQSDNYLPFIGFIITVFSGFRLAKFNIDKRQTTSFIGVPTPANTLFFLTIPLIWINEQPGDLAYELSRNIYLLCSLTFIFSYLLIAELPLIALKFKGFTFKKNIARYSLLALSAISIVLFGYLSIPIILLIYILISILESIFIKS